MIHHIFIVAVVALGIVAPTQSSAAVIYDAGALEFESTGQSMWAPGSALQKADSVFLGAQWTNRTATIGGIAGSANEVIIPAIGAVTAPVYEPTIWVPTPTWSDPFRGYWTGCGCWKNVTITPAIDAVTIDSRTGAKLDVTSSGKVGLEFGYSIDSGSVDTTANFDAMAELPDFVEAGELFSVDTTSIFDSGTIATQSPKAEAYISAIMQLSGSVTATACALTFGCAAGTTNLPTVDLDQRILSIDPNSLKVLDGIYPDGRAFAEVPILNQTLTLEGGATIAPPVVGYKLTGPFGVTIASSLPPTPAVSVDLAEVTVQVPDIATTGAGSGASVTSSGRDDVLSAQLDIDGAATLFAGLPPVGLNADLIDVPGTFKLSASLDLIDVDAGPVIGLTQDFEFVPTLMATLAFSSPVLIAGMAGLQTSWTGLWSDLPQFALTETTTFTPMFWLDAMLRNDLGIDIGLVGTLDVLKLGATASVAGIDLLNFNPISLNNLLGISNELFSTDKVGISVYDNSFKLGGFNTILGRAFTIAVNGTDASPVPEPGSFWLLIGGLAFLLVRRGHALVGLRRCSSV
jgi:hypothetical protein